VVEKGSDDEGEWWGGNHEGEWCMMLQGLCIGEEAGAEWVKI
jgi:hypothetical protein